MVEGYASEIDKEINDQFDLINCDIENKIESLKAELDLIATKLKQNLNKSKEQVLRYTIQCAS
jgi:hypothetical protein